MIAEVIISVLVLIGATFAFIGSWGLFKLPDFYMRLHGPTKATTLGLGGLLAASVVFFSLETGTLALHEVLITFFLFMTAPVSAHILAKAALQAQIKDINGEVRANVADEMTVEPAD